MKKLRIPAPILIAILALQSCVFMGPSVRGNGDVVQETRQVSNIKRIDVANGLDIHLVPDSTEYVVVEADRNLHEVIETVVKGQTLSVFTNTRIRGASAQRVILHFRKIEGIESSSGSSVRGDDIIYAKQLEISASSGSQQFLKINAGQLDSRCSSGAQLQLSGKCADAVLKASSGAQLNGLGLLVSSCSADVSSGAGISINVEKSLSAEASSGGNISYLGHPAQTNFHRSSGGTISAE